jgi:pimeloyl-ACP methyl ester carboxylesterase
MPVFERDNIKIYYEETGEGFPVLLFAPGGMQSTINYWHESKFNAIDELDSDFRVIAMDQRNAGQSVAPVSGCDTWDTYTRDHIALLDHLGIEKTHVMGGCIGGPYCLGMMKAAPGRVVAGVLQQSIGFDNNRDLFYEMFQSWADAIKDDHPEASETDWESFRSNMYGGDLDFNVGREFVKNCPTPMLVLMGSDAYHPEVTSREIAELAPQATLVENWKSPEDRTALKVIDFLKAHSPA